MRYLTQFVAMKFTQTENGRESYGFRAYDDQYDVYFSSWKNEPPKDDMAFLRQVLGEDHANVSDLIENLQQTQGAVAINGNPYFYDEIQHILEEVMARTNSPVGSVR